MTNDQTSAMLTVLYDARDLLLAIDRGWVRLSADDRDCEFVRAIRASVAHAKTLDIPAPPHTHDISSLPDIFDGMIKNPPFIVEEQTK